MARADDDDVGFVHAGFKKISSHQFEIVIRGRCEASNPESRGFSDTQLRTIVRAFQRAPE
jgi:hypothetical protein